MWIWVNSGRWWWPERPALLQSMGAAKSPTRLSDWAELRQHIKSRDINFANKGPSSQSYGFPVFMYGCESWTIKKAEHRRMDAFELSCWRRLLRVPCTARRSNQSILKEISPEYSLEGLMLKVKLQYFGYLMWRTESLAKTLMPGKDWRWEEKGTAEDEMVRWHRQLHGLEFDQASGVGDGQGGLACCGPWLSDWTGLNWGI